MRQSRAPRVARGMAAASVATFVALLSHVAAGGSVPGWLGLVVPWALSVMACTVMAGRRLSLLRLSIGVTISQVLFHALFVLGAIGPRTVASPAAHHQHGAVQLLPTSGGSDATAMMHADATMWMWHAAAAVVTIAALHQGERAVTRLGEIVVQLRDWVRHRSRPHTTIPLLIPAVRVVTNPGEPWHVSSVPQRSALDHRGPPSPHVL